MRKDYSLQYIGSLLPTSRAIFFLTCLKCMAAASWNNLNFAFEKSRVWAYLWSDHIILVYM